MSKIILLIGAPGSGKGTRGKICEEHGFIHISSSKLLRDAGYNLENPKHIPNEIFMQLLKKVISNYSESTTFILEGFPRRMEQLHILEKEFEVTKVIYLKISKAQAFKRIQNRIVCPNCGESFTTNFYKQPKNVGFCDNCGSILKKRASDTKEIFKKRYVCFAKYTYPIIHYYANQHKLITVDALSPNEEIIGIIKKALI